MLNRQDALWGIFAILFVLSGISTALSQPGQPESQFITVTEKINLAELNRNVKDLSKNIADLTQNVDKLSKNVEKLSENVGNLNTRVAVLEERTKGTAKVQHVILGSIIAPIVVAILVYVLIQVLPEWGKRESEDNSYTVSHLNKNNLSDNKLAGNTALDRELAKG